MKRQLMQELGFRSAFDGAQDYDLILRAVSDMMDKSKDCAAGLELPIVHIPKILYHWRCHAQSTAENPASKQYAYEAGKRSVEDFLQKRGWRGVVTHMRHLGFYRIEYQPDILRSRSDVGVVGGRLLNRRNRVVGGIYGADGTPLYLGLHKEFSGYMHRACLMQEAEVVDVRCMKVSKEAGKALEELLGHPCLADSENGRFRWRENLDGITDYQDLSRRFCDKVRGMGYRIVWDPAMTERIE